MLNFDKNNSNSLALARLAAFLFISLTASANDPVEIKKIEKDRNGDGVVDLRVQSHWRGKKRIMSLSESLQPSGIWNIRRSFWVNGHLAVTEVTPGVYGDKLTKFVYGPKDDDFEIFKTLEDGTTTIATAEELKRAKIEMAKWKEFFDQYLRDAP